MDKEKSFKGGFGKKGSKSKDSGKEDFNKKSLFITPSPVDIVVKNITESLLSGTENETKYRLHLQAIAESWPLDSRSEQFEKLVALLGMPNQNPATKGLTSVITIDKILPLLPDPIVDLEPIDIESTLGSYNVNTVLYLTPHDTTVKSFSGILRTFKIKPENFTVISSKPFASELLRVPVEDKSIDLLLISSLTHLRHKEKENLIKECARVLSVDGIIILREHDYNKSTQMCMSLNILNNYLYPTLSFHPTSRDEVEALFIGNKLIPLKEERGKKKGKDWTKPYTVSFQATTFDSLDLFKSYSEDKSKIELKAARNMKSKDLQTFEKSMTRLHDNSPELPYSKYLKDYGAVSVDWGQLKLFVTTLQALVEYWNPSEAPDLIVVYAGASPGNSIPILADLFPNIVWELYDPHPFEGVKESTNIHIHGGMGTRATKHEGKDKDGMYIEDENGETGLFTDDTASLYVPSNLEQDQHVFFISDIRTRSYTEINEEDEEVGNRVVLEEMKMQDKWVKIMNPYRAHLKTRLPYMNSENDFVNMRFVTTYEGDVILQPFTNHLSTETRLVPLRGIDGKYHKKVYDSLKYESQLAYHNAVTRETIVYENPTTSQSKLEATGLDNHYDSIFFLFVLQEYINFLNKYKEDIVTPRNIPIHDAIEMSKYVQSRLNPSHTGKHVNLEAKRAKRRMYVKPL